jgi:hypothetical protein
MALFEILLVLTIGQYAEDNLMNIRKEIGKRLRGVPLYSQEEVSNPMVHAKLFDTAGSGTWYITEYDGIDRAFGYVIGLDTSDGAMLVLANWPHFACAEYRVSNVICTSPLNPFRK